MADSLSVGVVFKVERVYVYIAVGICIIQRRLHSLTHVNGQKPARGFTIVIYIYMYVHNNIYFPDCRRCHIVALLFNRELSPEFIVTVLLIFQIPRGNRKRIVPTRTRVFFFSFIFLPCLTEYMICVNVVCTHGLYMVI